MIPPAAQLAERFELLGSWSPQALEVLRTKLSPRTLTAGTVLVDEGDHTHSVFLVWEGELVVRLQLQGRTEEIGMLGPGCTAGEVSLLDPGPATATVFASRVTTVFELSRESLDELYTMHPRAAANMLEALAGVLAGRVRDATEHLEQLRGMPEAAPRKPRLIDSLRSLIGLGRRRRPA